MGRRCAERLGNPGDDGRKPAGDDDGEHALFNQRPEQRACAGPQRRVRGGDLLQRLFRQARKQDDALPQGPGEVQLATHGPLGDLAHLLADTGQTRELVDAFGGDQRRIHVRDQQPAGREIRRPQAVVDRQIREQPMDDGLQRRDRPARDQKLPGRGNRSLLLRYGKAAGCERLPHPVRRRLESVHGLRLDHEGQADH